MGEGWQVNRRYFNYVEIRIWIGLIWSRIICLRLDSESRKIGLKCTTFFTIFLKGGRLIATFQEANETNDRLYKSASF